MGLLNKKHSAVQYVTLTFSCYVALDRTLSYEDHHVTVFQTINSHSLVSDMTEVWCSAVGPCKREV